LDAAGTPATQRTIVASSETAKRFPATANSMGALGRVEADVVQCHHSIVNAPRSSDGGAARDTSVDNDDDEKEMLPTGARAQPRGLDDAVDTCDAV
jgi:hypothetical protein